MLNQLQAFKTLYEQENMSPDSIAESEGMDVVDVKAALMQVSPKFRKDCGKEADGESKLNFSDYQAERALEKLAYLMEYADDQHLQFKAALTVLDEKKGRRDIVKGIQKNGMGSVMVQFNQMFSQVSDAANEAIAKAVGNGSSNKSNKLVEV